MKTIKHVAMSLVTLLFLFGTLQTNAGTPGKSETLKIKVEMGCGSCQAKIQSGLGKTEGVEKAVADLATKTVTITYDPAKTNKDKLVKAIETLGYRTEFTAKDAKIGHSCSDKEMKEKNCSGGKK
ncbi:MAG: heavy-metal-associated domain-containing protein [Bacteroidetes bacterium]|nr:heavy-metal-associated domain-containing protein [Bacteroidota bacterium]